MARSSWNENRVPKTDAELVTLYSPLVTHICRGDEDLAQTVWVHILHVGILGRYNPTKGGFHQLFATTVYRAVHSAKRGRKAPEFVDVEDLDTLHAPSEEARLEARSELQDFTRKVAERRPDWVGQFDAEDIPPMYVHIIAEGTSRGLPQTGLMTEIVRRRRGSSRT